MIFQEMRETFRRLVKNYRPYVASRGHGRWIIRYYQPVLRRWTDSGQIFFNKHDAESRLKNELLKRRAG
jgi:hypothetical protein